MSQWDDVAEIISVVNRYSLAMDAKKWELMDDVFLPDALIAMGETEFRGRADGVAAIRACIECCSMTHHMNSNFIVDFGPDGASVINNFRAWHQGIGERANETFEAMGTYRDRFVKTADGWRVAERREESPIVFGDYNFFSAAAPVWEKLKV